MTKQDSQTLCSHCRKEVVNEFCSYCGHPKELTRIDGGYILSEIGSVLNFKKGILYTIKELLLRPGKNIRQFILEDRNRLVKPIIFIIVCSLIYTLAQQILRFEDGYVNYSGPTDSATFALFDWIQSNYGYANILMAFFIAFWIKILFRKHAFNFFETLILLCFVIGIGMLIYTVFGIIETFSGAKVLHIGGILGFFYSSWAIGRFFDKTKKINYLKGLLSYLFGFITFFMLVVALGSLIDSIAK